ncbi:tauPI-stichotoxin-Hcr2b-like isoform X2 [Parasteatoda tepidariorum]|uniref:tauPI-stichotoxin-Hcr2b-like isoform X2 n=1 Tax=Parasteatoda tepidariorum TaxID=114398 RepID=UPI0039BD78F2
MFTTILIYILIQHIIQITKGLSKEDLCSLDPDFGGCSDYTELFYYNRFTGMEEKKVCDKKPVRGPCEGFIRRYFFNQETQECEEFIYGGCRGNSNNFRTLTECKEFCTHV